MKIKNIVSYQIERYPATCVECPAFSEQPYSCHNERGMEADCALGYMAGHDMRDYSGKFLFPGCKIRHDDRVRLMKVKA